MRRSKDTIRGFVLGVVITALIAAAPTAMATVGKKTIDVVYSDIRIVVDGKEVTPRNAGGQVVEPFSYEGTTYLPVRAAVDAITGGNKSVDWDQDTHTIYIGGKPAQEIVDMSTMKFYPGDVDAFTSDPQRTCFHNRQQTITPFNRMVAPKGTILLGSKYTTLQCSFAITDESLADSTGYVTFTNADTNQVLKTVKMKHGEPPVDITVDVTGVDKLNIMSAGVLYNATLTPIPQL